MGENNLSKEHVPLPSVRRLPLYLTVLEQFERDGREWVSTTDFSEVLLLKPIQVRKDLAHTGIMGKPKKGFKVDELISTIYEFLGWNSVSQAFLVGVGALGTALLGYGGFRRHGLDIVQAFDTSTRTIGKVVHGKEVLSMDELPEMARSMNVNIGIITVPGDRAQMVADGLVGAGIKGIWNFSPIKLQVPDSVVVQQEDISSGLAVLSVRLSRFEQE